MNLDDYIKILNRKLYETRKPPLNATEVTLLRGIFQDRTYNLIAEEAGYSSGYFTNVVAPELCRRLSELIGQRVTKKSCRVSVESYCANPTPLEVKQLQQELVESPPEIAPAVCPHYPSGAVPLNSPFYLERSPIEKQVYQEIGKPGALVRIKAPREMGKTSLLLRILAHARELGYKTVNLNLEQVDRAILNDLNQFLRWLCANSARQLQSKPRLDEYWDEDLGNKISCTLYFQDYLLEIIGDAPLVLALDEVQQIFEHPEVAKDFFSLLRSWYEEAKTLPIWQKLRLIVVHSTEIYVPLQLNQSPFNVGLPVQLTGFSKEEIQVLARCYGIDWLDGEAIGQLMDMVGGHPALVQIALYHLSRGEGTLSELLEKAPTSNGIYDHHLQRHWVTLEEQPELASALVNVMNATEPVTLNPILAYKLSSLGLIERLGNQAIPSCELYRRFFRNDRKNPEKT